jgi:hypothetical protein
VQLTVVSSCCNCAIDDGVLLGLLLLLLLLLTYCPQSA